MNKTLLKNFAISARLRLRRDVSYRLGLMGISESGNARPVLRGADVEVYEYAKGQQFELHGADIVSRAYLARKAADEGFDQLVEEVAYTWFNRLIAIRFMEVNDYLPTHTRVLSSLLGQQAVPDIVTHALEIDLGLTDREREQVIAMKLGGQIDPLFRFLFLKQCEQLGELLPRLFTGHKPAGDYSPYEGNAAGYTGFREDPYKLLLTLSCLDGEGPVARLREIPESYFNVSLPDEDGQPGGQVEIIGWLYQYYNTELKDDTFARLKKNIKISKERIPAATQLFTPRWIVRYMVENSLGRLWAEKLIASGDGRGEAEIARYFGWAYYVPEAPQEPQTAERLAGLRQERTALKPEDIRLIDPCMGSGHILVYAFDVLMQIYLSCGYARQDAALKILRYNLWGIDIDERAYQLSYFALMMKARQHHRKALTELGYDHLFEMKDSAAWTGLLMDYIADGHAAMRDDLETMKAAYADAKTFGSLILPPEVDSEALFRHWQGDIVGAYHHDMVERSLQEQAERDFMPVLAQHMALEGSYHVVVTNPPYMGAGNMDAKLGQYVKDAFPDSKSDLFAVFIERCGMLLKRDGYQAMITQHAWMFLSSYEKLRKKLMNRDTINMAHLGARAFEEIGGEVVQTTAFVKQGRHTPGYLGTYLRLIEPTTQQGKEDLFLEALAISDCSWRFDARQDNFSKIPGFPVAYWVSQAMLKVFDSGKRVGDEGVPKQGSTLGDNASFLRLWYEVVKNENKWFKCMKGGEYRRWYGNILYVLDWETNGEKVKATGRATIRSEHLLFQQGITWTNITSGLQSFRFMEEGFFFESTGTVCFIREELLNYLLGFLNTPVSEYVAKLLNPTLHLQSGDVANIPFLIKREMIGKIDLHVSENIYFSRSDWNAFEVSWDFKFHPLM